MSKKSIVIITLLIITTVVSSGFAVFNYDRYKTVVRKGENLDIDTLPIAKARGFLVANTLIYT